MSTRENDVWLEAAQDHFEGAVEQHNYPLALDVIEDVRDAGFSTEAQIMQGYLDETPVSQFAIISPLSGLI